MKQLSEHLTVRKKEIERYLKEANQWPRGVPSIVNEAIMQNLHKFTHISSSPDNVNGTIKHGILCEYSCLEDMTKDFTFFEELGLVNIRVGATPLGERPVNVNLIRISFMIIKDNLNNGDYEIQCIRDAPEKLEAGFLNDIMGGKIQ